MSDILAEEYLTIPEISERLKLDRHAVTAMFENEPGVLCIGRREMERQTAEQQTARASRYGAEYRKAVLRKYRTIRVPISVVNRVITRLSNRGR